jgi:alpha-glucosidase
VALNFSAEYQQWVLPEEFRNQSTVLLSTFMDRQGGQFGNLLELRGYEGVILQRISP